MKATSDFAINLFTHFTGNSPKSLQELLHSWGRLTGSTPKKSELLSTYRKLLTANLIPQNTLLESLLVTRKVRSQSGILPFAVMTKPYLCPGQCTYCPLELGMPKSYLSDEPAAQRAKQLDFDPYQQVTTRLKQLHLTGHIADKIEIIIVGGTFSAYPNEYRTEFVKSIFDALNGNTSKDIYQAHQNNLTSPHRVVGLSIETRPDWLTEKEIVFLRTLGVTKIQLGVQAFDEKILARIKRGHTLDAVATATQNLRNSGFKICYHFMPNLPGSTPEHDIEMAKIMYTDPRFIPDYVKIYPCAVIPSTELHRQFEAKEYIPYSDEKLINTLLEIKKITPKTVRIDRLVRDISKKWVVSGPLNTNIRQQLQTTLKSQGIYCKCVRCREVKQETHSSNLHLDQFCYKTLGGTEYFLSFVDNENRLYSLLRLRLPDSDQKSLFPELSNAAIIREVHTYGRVVALDDLQTGASQHQGLGKKLISTAESIARYKGYSKLAVISAIGTIPYYQKLGYQTEGLYQTKEL